MRKYISIDNYFKTQLMIGKKKDKNKLLKKVLLILCLSIIIFSLYTIFKWCIDNSKIRQINKKINKDLNINNSMEQGKFINPPNNKNSNYYYYVTFPFYDVSFSPFTLKNAETVAFIHLKNTSVNYPVVQTQDNTYYLNHSFDKKANEAGWIFMDYRNDINNLDDNTIIYGHARLDGTMFGSLKKTLTSNWQNELDNYVIFLSTPKQSMVFQIFSIYTIKKESYYITTNFSTRNKKQIWLNTMKKRNIAPIDTEVNINDKILTLSTCQNNQGGRIVIHAKLIKIKTNTM